MKMLLSMRAVQICSLIRCILNIRIEKRTFLQKVRLGCTVMITSKLLFSTSSELLHHIRLITNQWSSMWFKQLRNCNCTLFYRDEKIQRPSESFIQRLWRYQFLITFYSLLEPSNDSSFRMTRLWESCGRHSIASYRSSGIKIMSEGHRHFRVRSSSPIAQSRSLLHIHKSP